MNLFLNTRHLTGRREDHLTEFFAAALEIDSWFRKAYAKLVIAPFAEKNDWAAPDIVSVETQISFDEYAARPDMVITLRDGHVIACEHKLEAIETLVALNQISDEPVPQLARYLMIPEIDAVVFVRETLKPPNQGVLQNPKYICPKDRQHFLWRDFYPLLESSAHLYCQWLCKGFQVLGFTPPHPVVGDLSLPENQKNFAKLWLATRSRVHDLGWRVGTGSVVELYLEKPNAILVSQVWICPRNEQLLVRATPTSNAVIHEVLDRLKSVQMGIAKDLTCIEEHTVRRILGNVQVIDAWAPLRVVLDEHANGEDLERRLLEFVGPILDAMT